MLQSVNLRDYMLTNPVKVKPDDTILDAMQIIIDNKISGVCVVDLAGNLVAEGAPFSLAFFYGR